MDLDIGLTFVATLAVVVAATWAVWSAAQRWWFRPRKLERMLLSQGLRGSKYRFPDGDLRDVRNLVLETRRKPMPLSHCILDRVVPHLKRASDLYGDENKLPFFWFGPYPRVIIMDPEIVKDILSSKFGHFERLKSTTLGSLVQGLATYDGEKWAKHRKIINPAFQVEKLKMMIPAFSACCDELMNRWEGLAGEAGVCELNVFPEFQNLARDIISRAAFGSSYKEGYRIFELQAEQTELVVQAALTLYIPGFRFIPTKKNRRRNEIYREVRTLLRNMIEHREIAIRSGEASTDDLLGLLMESNRRHVQEHGDPQHNVSLTIEDVIEECKLFYFAGQETTSVLLTWTMIMLAMDPNWQDQAREEVLQVFGRHQVTLEGLSRLKIVTMILYEVFRLYPPVTSLIRQTYKEIKLGEFTFPPGVQIILPILLLQHSKEFWGDTAEEFNPGRFAEGISKATNNQLIFFPFGWGPQICIGQSFALTEAKMAVARILQRFSVKLSPSYAHAPITLITLHPQHGAQVILCKLQE